MELSVLGMVGEGGRTSEDRHVWRWDWLKPECSGQLFYHSTGMTQTQPGPHQPVTSLPKQWTNKKLMPLVKAGHLAEPSSLSPNNPRHPWMTQMPQSVGCWVYADQAPHVGMFSGKGWEGGPAASCCSEVMVTGHVQDTQHVWRGLTTKLRPSYTRAWLCCWMAPVQAWGFSPLTSRSWKHTQICFHCDWSSRPILADLTVPKSLVLFWHLCPKSWIYHQIPQ